MGWRKKIIKNTGIPDYKIEAIARCILPDILEDWHSEQMQREFTEWMRQTEYEESLNTNS